MRRRSTYYGNGDLGHDPPLEPPEPEEILCMACEAGYLNDDGVCQECGACAAEDDPRDPENDAYDVANDR